MEGHARRSHSRSEDATLDTEAANGHGLVSKVRQVPKVHEASKYRQSKYWTVI